MSLNNLLVMVRSGRKGCAKPGRHGDGFPSVYSKIFVFIAENPLAFASLAVAATPARSNTGG